MITLTIQGFNFYLSTDPETGYTVIYEWNRAPVGVAPSVEAAERFIKENFKELTGEEFGEPAQLTIEDLSTARDVLYSWLDAFQDDEAEEAIRVRKVIARLDIVIASEGATGRRLHLVKPSPNLDMATYPAADDATENKESDDE